jgi:hypothetical protein
MKKKCRSWRASARFETAPAADQAETEEERQDIGYVRYGFQYCLQGSEMAASHTMVAGGLMHYDDDYEYHYHYE